MSNAICLLVVFKQQQVLRRGKGSATSRPSGSAPSLADLAGPWDDPAEDSREEITPDAAPLYDAEPIVGGSSGEFFSRAEVWDQIERRLDGAPGSDDLEPSSAGPPIASREREGGALPRLVLQCLRPRERRALAKICARSLKAKLADAGRTIESDPESSTAEDDLERAEGECSAILEACAREAAAEWLRDEGGARVFAESEGSASGLAALLDLEGKRQIYATAMVAAASAAPAERGGGAGEGEGPPKRGSGRPARDPCWGLGWVEGRTAAVGLAGCADVLADCVLTIAESVCDAYLLSPATLPDEAFERVVPVLRTTRKMERFRNQIGVHRWWHKYFASVRSLYEDEYRVWSLSEGGALAEGRLACRRSREVASLSGVRRAAGLVIEASDLFLPMVRRTFDFVQEGVQILLVMIIGRSLGLIWRGIQESLRGSAGVGAGEQRRERKGKGSRGGGFARSKGGGGSGGGGGGEPPPFPLLLQF